MEPRDEDDDIEPGPVGMFIVKLFLVAWLAACAAEVSDWMGW